MTRAEKVGPAQRPKDQALEESANDTDYNEDSFFVRHAYFLGQNDPYGALKTTLKAEITPTYGPH